MKLEPFGGRGPLHLPLHRRRLAVGHPVLRHEDVVVIAHFTFRHRGIELVRAVDDLDAVAILHRGEAALEPALADIAPRTHDVGPDLNSDQGTRPPSPKAPARNLKSPI